MSILTIRFLGVLRLYAGMQLLELPIDGDSITLVSLLTELEQRFGREFMQQAIHLLLLLSPTLGEPGKVVSREDAQTKIPAGQYLTFVTPPSGG